MPFDCIIDGIKNCLSKRSTEFYVIMQYLRLTMDSFDPETGLYIKPTKLSEGYNDVPEITRNQCAKPSEPLVLSAFRNLGEHWCVLNIGGFGA